MVDAYAAFHWEHMRKEEVEVMPAAEQHLLPEDWAEIDAAFGSHGDPLFGADAETEFGTLFRRIVDLAPPPIGVGLGRSQESRVRLDFPSKTGAKPARFVGKSSLTLLS